MTRLQALKKELLPVQREEEDAIPLQLPWPPPVLLISQPLSQESATTCLKASGGEGDKRYYYYLLFQIRHLILTDLRLVLSRGRGGERFFRGQVPLEFEDVVTRSLRGPAPLERYFVRGPIPPEDVLLRGPTPPGLSD